ncbi:hypothetical protein PVK06_024777 [Gossypium arboreum]|uniref:RNase H type-1 domain-containing protein n=1 Tax=Gossypium arboreum TaxID=29729 RepID=A0ABR0PEL9_GOSAR|nr:hypothetical protein PVK06_024777 [Gossypium arboreum]
MLLGASRDPKLSLQDQDKDDSQLIEGDVSTRIEDGLPSIRFSERVHQILYQSFPDFFIGRVDLTSIGEMIVHVIKLDDNTGNAQRGRFVRLVVLLDINKPLVSKIKINGRLQCVEYESLPSTCFSCRRYGRSCDSCSFVSAQDGQNDILTVQKDSRDLNQGDNRESNPTVSAKLKGKKVAIYNNSLVEEGSPLKPQLGYASALARSSREGIKEAGPGNGQAATGFDLDGPSFTAGHRISNLGMIVGPSNVDYGPTISNGSHGALIANTATSNSNSSLPKSTHFLADLPVSPTKNLPSRINVISKQVKSNVFVEKIEVTTLNSDCHSVIKFVEIRNPNNSKGKQPINISSRTQDERNVGSDALKMGDTKRPRKTPIFFWLKEVNLRFRQSEDLGTYLGVHLFHKRVTKNTFNFIVGKVRWKLDNWNAIMLSMAGRVTLARIVLLSIPNYFMQTVLIFLRTMKRYGLKFSEQSIRLLRKAKKSCIHILRDFCLAREAIYDGFHLAWDFNWKEVILENNCAQAIKGIHGGFKGQANRDLKLLIQELGIPDWQVVIKNILKEANFAPHILVGLVKKFLLGFREFHVATTIKF